MSLADELLKATNFEVPSLLGDELDKDIFQDKVNLSNLVHPEFDYEPINYESSLLKEQAEDISNKLQQHFNPQIYDIHKLANIAESDSAQAKKDAKFSKIISMLTLIIAFISLIVSIISIVLSMR